MKQEQVKQKVRQAVEHAAPDYSDRLREAADQLSAAPAGPRRSRRPRRLIAAVAAVAACAVLAVGALGIVRSQASQQGTAVVVLDVNPSILLSINSEERVLSVVAQNSDASRILDGMDLTGVQLNVAVNALIGSLLKNGYISELANSILISVEGADAQEAAQLQQRLTTEINELLAGFGIDGAILSQTLGQDDEVTALANSYEISRGKAALILQLMGQNPTLRAEDLAGLTINALNLLLAEPQNASQNASLTLTGTASESGYIGTDAATAAALSHAGIDAAKAERLSAGMDVEAGRMVYEVEFAADSLEYECDVDALTGEVVKFSTEQRDGWNAQNGNTAGNANGSAATGDIGREAALAAALQHAGLTEAEITNLYVKADRDDGRAVYDVEFLAGGNEYDYEIDAATGAVRSFDTERDHSIPAGGSATGGTAATGDIGRDAAVAAALQHAGLTEAEITNLYVKADRDDGRTVYDVEFLAGGKEYDYEIDAATGAVRSFDTEREHGAASGSANSGNAASGSTGSGNASSGSTTDIGADAAKNAAFRHAGVSASDATRVKVERDRDNGVLLYEVEFRVGNYEYEYEISATTGEVLGHSREVEDD